MPNIKIVNIINNFIINRANGRDFRTVSRPIHLNLSAFYFYFRLSRRLRAVFALYLTSVGMNAVEIGVLMALPQLTRILAPHRGWLADHTGRRIGVVRVSGAAGMVAFLGVFAGDSFRVAVWRAVRDDVFSGARLCRGQATTRC